MNRPGDWHCRSCHHLNFQRRGSCQRCGDLKTVNHVSVEAINWSTLGFVTGPDVRPGDWYCSVGNCGTHNFASRSTCFKCGEVKSEAGGGSSGGGRSSWKSGDWVCYRPGCNEHNFASRVECFRCNAPKEPNYNSSFSMHQDSLFLG